MPSPDDLGRGTGRSGLLAGAQHQGAPEAGGARQASEEVAGDTVEEGHGDSGLGQGAGQGEPDA
jgi:hypothetical protein